jgi:hypothetical protein
MYSQADTLGLIFTGTTNAQQIAGHCLGAVGTPIFTQSDVFSNAFFYRQYLSLWPVIAAALPSEIPARVLVSGHSYGGAMAHLIAWGVYILDHAAGPLITRLLPPDGVQLLTFGQPRTFTTGLKFSPYRYYRLVNGADLVPLVPPLNTGLVVALPVELTLRALVGKGPWTHYGSLWLTGPGQAWRPAQDGGDSPAYNLARWPVASVQDHLTESYARSIIQWLET